MSRPGKRSIWLMAALAVGAFATTEVAIAAELMKSSPKGVYSRSRPPAGLEPRYKRFCRSNACSGSYANNKHKFHMNHLTTRRLIDRRSRHAPARAGQP